MKQLFILIFFSIFALDVFAQLRPSESQYFVEKGVLVNPSFEQGYQGWVITGCTKSLVSETPYLNKSLKLTCTNETFSIKQVSTALTNFSKQQGAFDLQIKTTASGVNVSSITNGVRDNAYSVINSTEFKRFKEIGFIVGDTDNGIEVYSDTNFTGEIVLDNVKLGLGNLTQDIGAAHQVGILDFRASGCSQTMTNATFDFFPSSANCIPDATTSLAGDLSAPDENRIGLKLTPRTDGVYVFTYSGMAYRTGGAACIYILSATGSFTNQGVQYADTQSVVSGSIEYRTRFNSSTPVNVYPMARQTGGAICQIYGDNVLSSQMSAEFFPDSKNTIVSQDTELTAKTANRISTGFNGVGAALTEEYEGAITCTDAGSGNFNCLLNGLDLSVIPAFQCTVTDTAVGSRVCAVRNKTTSSFSVSITRSDTATGEGRRFDIEVSKQGADVNKSQTIVGSFEQIRSDDLALVEGAGNGNTNLIASVTPVDFTETRDITSSWDGTTFTAPKTADYQIKGMIFFNALETSRVDAYVNTGGGYVKERSFGFEISSNYLPFNGILRLNEGDLLQILQTTPAVLSNNTEQHWISITEIPTKESIVANLMQGQTTKCQTKFLSANVTTTGAVTDIGFSSLDVSKFYSLTLATSTVANTGNNCSVSYNDGSVTVLTYFERDADAPADRSIKSTHRPFFKPNTASLTATFAEGVTCILEGSGDTTRTYATLCELPDTVIETTEFN